MRTKLKGRPTHIQFIPNFDGVSGALVNVDADMHIDWDYRHMGADPDLVVPIEVRCLHEGEDYALLEKDEIPPVLSVMKDVLAGIPRYPVRRFWLRSYRRRYVMAFDDWCFTISEDELACSIRSLTLAYGEACELFREIEEGRRRYEELLAIDRGRVNWKQSGF